jgi:hypothetical protein
MNGDRLFFYGLTLAMEYPHLRSEVGIKAGGTSLDTADLAIQCGYAGSRSNVIRAQRPSHANGE